MHPVLARRALLCTCTARATLRALLSLDSRRLTSPPAPLPPPQDKARNPNAKPPAPNPLLLGRSPSAHVLQVVGRVRAAELEQALLLLPFTDALRLMGYLVGWLRQGAQVCAGGRAGGGGSGGLQG